MAASSDKVSQIYHIFNNYHDRLKFTIEYENNHCLNFLDLMLTVIDNKIYIDWFHKKTFSGRSLSYYSSHSQCHKIGIISSLVDRAFLLSHPRYHKKNLEFCINTLLDNGYSLKLIFQTMNNRLKKLICNNLSTVSTNINNGTTSQERKFFVIPYIKNISE